MKSQDSPLCSHVRSCETPKEASGSLIDSRSTAITVFAVGLFEITKVSLSEQCTFAKRGSVCP
jgi:hypothetical protein